MHQVVRNLKREPFQRAYLPTDSPEVIAATRSKLRNGFIATASAQRLAQFRIGFDECRERGDD
jgi:hypothetical protein